MHEKTACGNREEERSGSATLCIAPALLPNTCSLSKRGLVTALLPEKSPTLTSIYQVAALGDAPPGINAPINQGSLWAVVTSIAFRQPDALLYTLFNSLFMWRLDIFYRASYYRT